MGTENEKRNECFFRAEQLCFRFFAFSSCFLLYLSLTCLVGERRRRLAGTIPGVDKRPASDLRLTDPSGLPESLTRSMFLYNDELGAKFETGAVQRVYFVLRFSSAPVSTSYLARCVTAILFNTFWATLASVSLLDLRVAERRSCGKMKLRPLEGILGEGTFSEYSVPTLICGCHAGRLND